MSIQRFLGVFLLVAGAIALIVGINSSHSAADQISNAFTGRFTQATAVYFLGGGAACIIGFLLIMVGIVRKQA
jgi:hypothetical protein